MARYNEAKCKICRRIGEKLFIKGQKCLTKCILDNKKRQKPPGQHGDKQQRRTKVSDYGIRLREKQKSRAMSGILERQFRRYFAAASKKKGLTGTNLLLLLETRLDNVVYLLGLSSSRAQARQLVTHGKVLVNNHKVDIPSYQLKINDEITVSGKAKENVHIKKAMEDKSRQTLPSWLTFDSTNLVGKIVNFPAREEMSYNQINEQLVVEFYSR